MKESTVRVIFDFEPVGLALGVLALICLAASGLAGPLMGWMAIAKGLLLFACIAAGVAFAALAVHHLQSSRREDRHGSTVG